MSVGVLTTTERLGKPVAAVADAFTAVSLSEPLLSHSQKQRLNPLVVHVHSATNMPLMPVPFSELKTRHVAKFLKLFLRLFLLSYYLVNDKCLSLTPLLFFFPPSFL